MPALTFTPIYMPRVWGGRRLETTYHRRLPDAQTPFGEAWEIVDRPEAQSVIDHGPRAGVSLHDLWQNHRASVFGEDLPDTDRFPVLVKILDCAHDLSIQVHPPAHVAASLGGEAKTEMWFIADALPGSKLYVGLKKNTDPVTFERAIREGNVADHVHTLVPQTGESIFIPSGRLHAIGAGFLIHEIQQNSDTTYRVFDWNRHDVEGKPRQLHIPESLASIDFTDIEPEMTPPSGNILATCTHFHTVHHRLDAGQSIANPHPERFSLVTIIDGKLLDEDRGFPAGQTVLLPRGCPPLKAGTRSSLLQITLP